MFVVFWGVATQSYTFVLWFHRVPQRAFWCVLPILLRSCSFQSRFLVSRTGWPDSDGERDTAKWLTMSHLYSTCWKLCQDQNPPLNGMATPSRFTSPFLARAATCLPIWVLLISVSHDGKRCFTWPIPSVPFLFWSQYDTTQEHFWMELALASPVWGLMMLAYLPQTNRGDYWLPFMKLK